MEVVGLPLHALVLHAAVVFGPLAALTALVFAVVPRWRPALRWPTLAVALAAVGAIALAWWSGGSYLDDHPELRGVEAVRTHERRADVLIWVTLAFGAVTALAVRRWGPTRPDTAAGTGPRTGTTTTQWILAGLLVAVSLVLLALVVATGDAGSRAVWG